MNTDVKMLSKTQANQTQPCIKRFTHTDKWASLQACKAGLIFKSQT